MPTRRMTVVFMGSPPFAVPTLQALVDTDFCEVPLVVTQPDRPKGRGKKVAPTAVKACALEREVPVTEMAKPNYGEVVARLREISPDFVVVAAFGVILKEDLLSLPAYGCINLHASLLPRHRGMSPIQAAILAGDRETGCTTMRMDAGVDTGDMLLQESTPIEDEDTAGTLESRLSRLGAPLMVRTLQGIVDGQVRGVPQDDALATYARRIRKEHGQIDWTEPAVRVWRRIRAMTPWPSAYTAWGRHRIIVTAASPDAGDGSARAPGSVVSLDPLTVAAGDGVLRVRRVKVAGKAEMDATAFVSGYRIREGETLGG